MVETQEFVELIRGADRILVFTGAGISTGSGIPYVVLNRGPTDHDGHAAVTLRLGGDVVTIFPPAVREALSDT